MKKMHHHRALGFLQNVLGNLFTDFINRTERTYNKIGIIIDM